VRRIYACERSDKSQPSLKSFDQSRGSSFRECRNYRWLLHRPSTESYVIASTKWRSNFHDSTVNSSLFPRDVFLALRVTNKLSWIFLERAIDAQTWNSLAIADLYPTFIGEFSCLTVNFIKRRPFLRSRFFKRRETFERRKRIPDRKWISRTA